MLFTIYFNGKTIFIGNFYFLIFWNFVQLNRKTFRFFLYLNKTNLFFDNVNFLIKINFQNLEKRLRKYSMRSRKSSILFVKKVSSKKNKNILFCKYKFIQIKNIFQDWFWHFDRYELFLNFIHHSKITLNKYTTKWK